MRKLLAALILISCIPCDARKAKIAKPGMAVAVEYVGKVDNGIIFDTNVGQQPLRFILGDNSVLKGFDDGVTGMKVGETKTINIPADYAYGNVNLNKIFQVPITQIQTDMELKEGANLRMQGPDGAAIPVRVVEITDKDIYLDANHLLAGKDLSFELKLLATDEPPRS